jgi:chitinase
MKTDGTLFISYDNPRSIMEKSEYIIEHGLAGMMYWENGLDSTGALLLAMEEGLKD